MTVHIIGRYKIIRELRRGGMATVYRAYDPHFEREVAIKVLPRELLFDPQFRARFETEAKTLASLEHSAIVPVYDYGEQDGLPYLVMRYMPAGSLEDRLKQGTIPLVEAARILGRLAPALDEAHARGLVHRDLKPANILFDQRNEPFITDFGVVKISGTRLTDTSNRSIGTPAYMSPEQARGEADIDGRSDIFALGAVLYEMLTGKIPYDADTAAGQLVRRITDPVPNILDLRPDLPGGVQEIIARSLAKRRYVRFPTASDMAQALDAVAQGRTPRETLVLDKHRTMPNGLPVQAGKTGSRQPRVVLKPKLHRQQPVRVLLRGAGILIAALALTALFYFGWQAVGAFSSGEAGIGGLGSLALQQTGTAQAGLLPSPTLAPAGSVVAVNGRAQVQAPGQAALALTPGMVLANVPGLRVWTDSGTLKLSLDSGAEVWLAESTAVTLPTVASPSTFAHLELERGRLLVRAEQILVTTNEPELRVAVAAGSAGVDYDPTAGRFLVDCLEGLCRVGQDPPQDLSGGQRGGFDQGQPLEPALAQYDDWMRLGGAAVPTPTATATLTPTVTATATATNTPEPSPTPEATATTAPPVVFPTSPPSLPQPTNPPAPQPTSPPRPTNTSAPPPTNPPAPTATSGDPNQG
jgi:serine/threonine-protein kinase